MDNLEFGKFSFISHFFTHKNCSKTVTWQKILESEKKTENSRVGIKMFLIGSFFWTQNIKKDEQQLW